MKLLNYTNSYFGIALFVAITIWAGVFYFAMMDEVYDSIDDGLGNTKMLVIQKAAREPRLLKKNDFEERGYAIREINKSSALNIRDQYIDTLMYMQLEGEDEPVRMLKTAFEQDGKYYELRVVTSMVESDDLLGNLLFYLACLYGGLILTILVINNVLLKKIWQPFYHLLGVLKNYRLEQPEMPSFQKTNVEEFQMLSDTVETLLDTTKTTYNSQKQFIENASHELQTPLAIGLNKLELLLEKNELSEEQTESVNATISQLQRLVRLNKSLLLLTKIENKQFIAEQEVDWAELAPKVLEDFADQAEFKNVKLLFEKSVAEVKQRMNIDLAEMLLVNLIKNAIVHNVKGGEVSVKLSSAELIIENTGKQTALDEEKVFKRFYKNEQNPNSTGLGLAIVKAIADLYQLKVGYQYNGKHVVVIHW